MDTYVLFSQYRAMQKMNTLSSLWQCADLIPDNLSSAMKL